MPDQYQAIREAFTNMRRAKKSRHRDIADALQISEGELIAAHVGASIVESILQAIRLRPDWAGIIESLEPLGEVMALTRNASCVHEKIGVYRKASHNHHVGLVFGGEIDLRLFYSQWVHGFAVTEETDQGPQHSLQFFDATGTAIHKIFMKPQSDSEAYALLVTNFFHESQTIGISAIPANGEPPEKADGSIDVAGFRQAWAAMQDTHEFFGLLRKFSVSRTQGLRLADSRYVQKVGIDQVNLLLHAAARQGVAIMVFVGNPGVIQIHSGPIYKVASMGPWLNVLDPGFNLHLREDHIANAWIVKKPTVDGIVTSLEIFDQSGETIAMIFGERKPGKPELQQWRSLVENLLQEPESCAA